MEKQNSRKKKKIIGAAVAALALGCAVLLGGGAVQHPGAVAAAVRLTDIHTATAVQTAGPFADKMRLPEFFLPPAMRQTAQRFKEGESGKRLCPGGMPFGVRLMAEGVIVAEASDPKSAGAQAGLRKGDVILSIDGTQIRNAQQLSRILANAAGKTVRLTVRRGESEMTLEATPTADEQGAYRLGVRVRDSAAGIGTVTYIDPDTGVFGGLGHGICDADTGTLIPVARGAVMDVTIGGIRKGTPGTPGELRGALHPRKTGTLLKNCPYGVFGVFAQMPTQQTECIPVGRKEEMHEGDAVIRCTLDQEGSRDYAVVISDIHYEADAVKCFAIHVKDPALIEKTGGIVQGMSGSPVIQEGKLVGAVTHVLISDPTGGYGIFIEQMLREGEIPQQMPGARMLSDAAAASYTL